MAATSQQPRLFRDYEGFVEKFKNRKTTDDCYTPPEVYDVVADWVTERYGIPRESMVRPFYPGGDYETHEYPEGCCVVDNPPFSKLSQITRFYLAHDVRFFMFSPTLTGLRRWDVMEVTHIYTDAKITYDNGARIPTSFVTNMGGDIIAQSEPELSRRIRALHTRKRRRPRTVLPDNVLTGAGMEYLARHGQRLTIRRNECTPAVVEDLQDGHEIYGGGLLLCSDAAERYAAARSVCEQTTVTRLALSPHGRNTVHELDARQ